MFEDSRYLTAAKTIRIICHPLVWMLASETRAAQISRHVSAIMIYTWLIESFFERMGSRETSRAWALAAAGALIFYFPFQFVLSRLFSQLGPSPPLAHRLLVLAQFLLVLIALATILVGLLSFVD